MADIDFGKQIGPLPLGAWIVVVGGGLGIALWSRQQNAAPPVEVVDTGGVPGVGDGGSGSWVDIGKPPTDSTSPIGYATNEAWGQAAINWLIAQGYAPGMASAAITKALAGGEDISGNKMSIQEWSLWTLALRQFGSPPQPVNVSPPSSVPGPVTPPTNPPPVTPPAPKPNPNPKPNPQPEQQGRYATWYITPVNRTLGALVNAHNRKHGTRLSVSDVWNYNLKWRSASTRAKLLDRGPNFVYLGSTFWMPY